MSIFKHIPKYPADRYRRFNYKPRLQRKKFFINLCEDKDDCFPREYFR